MDPLFDYYLCTKDGDTELWSAFAEDLEVFSDYDSVRKIPFWQAVLWDRALAELERASGQDFDLHPLAAFVGADADRITELFGGEDIW